ncbi:hypothetical protein HB779_07095 [Phyllobacterium sp. 628]|uniref:hypothetical protein n=1 Tax=Phyllobacterium sp. 628 TaxID=2718938 RepID=UPI0016621F80|nr:hypothetical protein [Phyllobacterium sp. 628]QND51691.1 hypothetical protein HB779_07095 [Phyllobacterium sp. 628]
MKHHAPVAQLDRALPSESAQAIENERFLALIPKVFSSLRHVSGMGAARIRHSHKPISDPGFDNRYNVSDDVA